MSELKDKILEEYQKGNIVIATPEGLQGTKLSEFIKQPTNGLLYDLNRNEEVILTFIDDPKWVNDYAVCQVIRALKELIENKEQLIAINAQQYFDCKDEVYCNWYNCPKCGYDYVRFENKFCPDCGCKFEWSGYYA